MSLVANKTGDTISTTIDRYVAVMGRSLGDTLKRGAKGITRRVISITPPANAGAGELSSAADAYRAGRMRIARQMNYLMAPVRLKGRRTITKVFGRTIATPVTIKTTERWPDVASLYRANSRVAASGFGIRTKVRRGAKFYVSSTKFSEVLRQRQARVGVLASGWMPAARRLEVDAPQWVSRHGTGNGAIFMDLFSLRMGISVRNFAPGLPSPIRSELARRIPYAVAYQRAAMEREITYMAGKQAQSLGLKTRNFSAMVPAGMNGS